MAAAVSFIDLAQKHQKAVAEENPKNSKQIALQSLR